MSKPAVVDRLRTAATRSVFALVMAGFRPWSFALVLGLALVCVTSTSSQATPILDQSQTIVGTGFETCSGTATLVSVCGQSFTVGQTGTLTSVDFFIQATLGTPEGVIYTDVSASGGTLAQTSPTVLVFGAPGFYSFVFNYPIVTGDVLFFGLRSENGDAFAAPLVSLGNNPYLSGGYFLFVPPDLAFLSGPEDATFRTFVETDAAVPEPASLTLLGLGLAGMAGRRWRQRKAT